ncbi:MAG: crossover junction endodeoxyribonuclease RuvC [Candidatus Goldbacteria bacterium]|mgnify:CR=1 FL=1|nr:crossover junction endodeoxyribonuclease RuvC [Candidatus Goldiibacteriota bacterium]
MIILGIDPGMARCGFGVIEKKGNVIKYLSAGVIESTSDYEQSERLEIIYKGIKKLIKKYKPYIIAIESLFFNRNAKTALSVGEARGVILLAAQLQKTKIMEFTPLQVKMSTTGYGMAEKLQVQKMVKALLGLKEIPKPDDAADALAIAICCINSLKIKMLT